MPGLPYSTEELKQLRDMFDTGMTYDQIAQGIGRSRHSIEQKVNHLGWSRYIRWDQYKLFALESLSNRGNSRAVIARHFKVSPVAITRARQAAEIGPHGDAYTGHQLAEALGRAWPTIRPWLKRAYIPRTYYAKNRLYLITLEDACAFLDNPMYWPLWEARDISDPLLRDYADSIKKERFLTVRDIAKAIGRAVRTVYTILSSATDLRKIYIHCTYYVRLSWLKEWLQAHHEYPIMDRSVLA